MRISKRLLGCSLVAATALTLGGMASAAEDSPAPVVRHAVGFAISPPLRDLAKVQSRQMYGFHEANPVRRVPKRLAGQGRVVDAVEQSTPGAPGNYAIGLNLLGVGTGFPGYTVPDAPPDTNMAVGDTQVVQWVNTSYAVFDKTSGAILAGPIEGNVLWTAIGGACFNNNDGDIIAQWDKAAHRWLLTQNVFSGPPYYACVAISQTPDALGSYYEYQFSLGNGFPDYPKWGTWPGSTTNVYGETMNNFGSGNFVGPEVCVYQRVKLLAGDHTAGQVCFQLAGDGDSLLPADIDSLTPPPPNEDQFFIGSLGDVDNSHLSLYSVHLDWTQPQNGTITGNHNSQLIAIPTFTPACNGGYGGDCVPQEGITDKVDSLGDRLMYRFAYWEDQPAAHVGPQVGPLPVQHWFVNHDVTASGGQNAVRWYEFRGPLNTTTVAGVSTFQSGTFAPDSNWRWMGSLTRDKVGDILVGYSESNTTMYPSIYIAGRVPGDSLGTLENEVSVVNGTGSQPDTANRWGDYSSMHIDMADGCTFWYTTEYYTVTQTFDWSTQLASVKFAGCH